MRINFDISEMTYEIYIGDQLVNRETIQAPFMIHKSQYLNLIQQVANDNRPMKFKIIKQEQIWDEFEQKTKILNNYIEFSNNAMVNKQ